MYLKMVKSVHMLGIDCIEMEFFPNANLIVAVDYRQSADEKTSIQVFDNHLNTLQVIYNDGHFVKVLQIRDMPKLFSCNELNCSIYHWHDTHFIEPRTVFMNYRVTQLYAKEQYIIAMGQAQLYFYNQMDLLHPLKFDVTFNNESTEFFLLRSKFQKLYTVVVSAKEQKLAFHFIEIKENEKAETEPGLLQNTPLVDPLQKILNCADQLKRDFNEAFAMITKINTILPLINSSTVINDVNSMKSVNKIIVDGKTEMKKGSMIKQFQFEGPVVLPSDVLLVLDRIRMMKATVAKGAKQLDYLKYTFEKRPENNILAKSRSTEDVPSIKVTKLITKSNLFKDLLSRSNKNVIQGSMTVQNLNSEQIWTESNQLNKIKISSMGLRNKPQIIEHKKSFNAVVVENLQVDQSLNNVDVKNLIFNNKNLGNMNVNNIKIKNLEVDNINGINFKDFIANAFIKNVSSKIIIDGSLTLENLKGIEQLTARSINSIAVNQMLDLVNEQTINRRVIINQFFVRDMKARTINDIENLKEAVALLGQDNEIITPVKVNHLKVHSQLILAENEARKVSRHIVGTQVDDLTQIYTGKVVINGDLIINTATMNNPLNLFLKNKQFTLGPQTNYWLKQTYQSFDSVVFTGKVETTQILGKFLNDHPADDYLFTDQKTCTNHVDLVFNSARVAGNIVTDGNNLPKVVQISRDAIRRNEKVIIQNGRKRFDLLIADHFLTTFINNSRVSDKFLHSHSIFEFEKKIKIGELRLNSNLKVKSNNIQVGRINNVDVKKLVENAVFIDQDFELRNLTLQTALVEKVFTENINGKPCNTESWLNIRFVVNVDGDVHSKEAHFGLINGIDPEQYFSLLFRRDQSMQIGGRKKFLGGISVLENLEVTEISGVVMKHWMENVLRNSGHQTITGDWVFKSDIEAPKISVGNVNNKSTTYLIDSKLNFEFSSPICVENLLFTRGNLRSKTNPEWVEIWQRLHNPIISNWQMFTVTENVYIPEGNSIFWDLVSNAMNETGLRNVYKAITFNNRVKIGKLTTNNWKINNVNLEEIFKDILLKHSKEDQVVSAEKSFTQTVKAENMRAPHLFTHSVNGHDIAELNQSIWRPKTDSESPVLRFKHPITVNSLTVTGKVNGVDVYDLTTFQNMNHGELEFGAEIHVENTSLVEFVNGFPMDQILNNRVKLFAPKFQHFTGEIIFENLVIEGKSVIHSINDVVIDSLMLSVSDKPQEVVGMKEFESIHILGPSSIKYLNNIDLSEFSNSMVLKNIDQRLSSLNAREIILKNGIIVTQSINGIPIDYFKEQPTIAMPNITEAAKDILSMIPAGFTEEPKNRTNRFSYFEYAKGFEAPMVINIFPLPCGAEKCRCKRQTNIKITPNNKIRVQQSNVRPNGEMEKSYNNVQMSVNSCSPQNQTYLTITTPHLSVNHSITGSLVQFYFLKSETNERTYAVLGIQHETNFMIKTFRISPQNVTLPYALLFRNIRSAFLHVMSLKQQNLLIVSTLSVKNHKILRLYKFNAASEDFKIQSAIPTYFNLIHDVSVEDQTYLFMAKNGHRKMYIYRVYKAPDGRLDWQLVQQLNLPSTVIDVTSFSVSQSQFIAMLYKIGSVEIYKYNYLQVSC